MEELLRRREAGDRTRMLVLTGVLAAIGCAGTMALRVPSPTGGYVNLGDAVVLMGAYLLGPVWGAAAGALGPALADLLAGYAVYVPATLVIKGAMAALAAGIYRAAGRRGWGLAAAGTAAEAVMVLGYCLYDGLLAGTMTGGLPGVSGNLVQGVFGAAASSLLMAALGRSALVRRVFSGS